MLYIYTYTYTYTYICVYIYIYVCVYALGGDSCGRGTTATHGAAGALELSGQGRHSYFLNTVEKGTKGEQEIFLLTVLFFEYR